MQRPPAFEVGAFEALGLDALPQRVHRILIEREPLTGTMVAEGFDADQARRSPSQQTTLVPSSTKGALAGRVHTDQLA